MNSNSDPMEQELEKLLHSALYRFDCPSPEQWHSYYWDELAADVRAQLEGHLPECDPCSAQLAQLQALMAVDDISEMLSVSGASVDHASNEAVAGNQESLLGQVTDGLRHRLDQALDQIQYVIATLVEPPAGLSPVALRSGKSAPLLTIEDATSLTFEAGETTLSLILQREADGTLRLSGQILSLEPLDAGAVKMVANESSNESNSVYESTLDGAGSFFFLHVEPTNYQLTVLLATTTIIIPSLRIA